jgi:CrcB protein
VRAVLAAFVGGALGTALRLGIDLALPITVFPLSTLVINTLGAFALAILVARAWPVAPDWLRAGLGAGLLGSFTTFSAVAVSVVALAHSGEWMPAATYLAATLIFGLAAAALGLRLGPARPAAVIDLVDE